MNCKYCDYKCENDATLRKHISRKHPEHKISKEASKIKAKEIKARQKKIFSVSKEFMSEKKKWANNYANLDKWRKLCEDVHITLEDPTDEFDLEYFASNYNPNKYYVQLFTAPDTNLTDIPWVLFDFPIKTKCFCNLIKSMEATEKNLQFILDNRHMWHEHHVIEVPQKFYEDDINRGQNFISKYFDQAAIRIKKVTTPAHFLNLIVYLACPYSSSGAKTHYSFGDSFIFKDLLNLEKHEVIKKYPIFERNQYHSKKDDPEGWKLRANFVENNFSRPMMTYSKSVNKFFPWYNKH